MTPSRPVISLCSALLLCMALPVAADSFDPDTPSSLGGGHGVYLDDGRMLTASPARQLTLRARVQVFDYSPTGEKIAYEGITVDHGQAMLSIKVVDTWRGDPVETTVAKGALIGMSEGEPQDMIAMAGWSGDGRYLMVERITVTGAAPTAPADGGSPDANAAPAPPVDGSSPDANAARAPNADGSSPSPNAAPSAPTEQVDYECFDTLGDLSSPKVVHAASPTLGVAWPRLEWSPSHAQALIFIDADSPALRKNPAAASRSVTIYRPGADSRRTIACPAGDIPLGWLDEQSLLMKKPPTEKGAKSKFLRYEIAGGTETEIPRPAWWDSRPELYFPPQRLVDPKSPDLTLETALGKLPDTAAKNTVDACAIWIRRAAPGKKYTVMPIGIAPGIGPPQTQWSPAGDAIAFVAHGDLFVSDLVKRDATARETLDAGGKLDCAEETAIATSNLKQIGLGVIQYCQDNDDHLPPAAGFHDSVYPYIKSEDVFTLGDSKFVYKGPNMGPLASINDPASFVMGEMNTPCARVVLYADGHVKAVDK